MAAAAQLPEDPLASVLSILGFPGGGGGIPRVSYTFFIRRPLSSRFIRHDSVPFPQLLTVLCGVSGAVCLHTHTHSYPAEKWINLVGWLVEGGGDTSLRSTTTRLFKA